MILRKWSRVYRVCYLEREREGGTEKERERERGREGEREECNERICVCFCHVIF